MSTRLESFALTATLMLALTACSDDASACERLDAYGGDQPGPTASADEQREFQEVFAQCMQEEPERGAEQ